MKPFEYLNGMVPEPDAPLVDNPGGFYCPQCREQDKLHCDDPGMCGNLRLMRPLPKPEEPAPLQVTPSKQLPPVKLDDSAPVTGRVPGREPLPHNLPKTRRFTAEEVFPERLMGRKTTITQLPDGEQSYEWFMEQMDPEKWK